MNLHNIKSKYDMLVNTLIQNNLKTKGLADTIETLIDVEKEITHATLFTKKYNNYFANGMLSGNRHSKEINL